MGIIALPYWNLLFPLLLALPLFPSSNITFARLNSSTVQVTWEQIQDIPKELVQYYGYTVAYKGFGDSDSVNGPDYPHAAGQKFQTAVVKGLVPLKHYYFKIRPYRQMKGQREYGWASSFFAGPPIAPSR